MSAGSSQSTVTEASDDELLQRHRRGGGNPCLAELIRRFAPMVYAAARRQLHDATLAEDVMQNVFIIFARRIREIRSGPAIGPWLLRTTRFASANAIKSQSRRRHYEQAAAGARPPGAREVDPMKAAADAEEWRRISPLLDSAIARLGGEDQTALVLRFFRGQSVGEISAALGISEVAARKRLARAVQRLREHLLASAPQSGAITEASLAGMLSIHAIEPVPSSLLASATAAAAGVKAATVPLLFGGALVTTTKFTSGLVVAAVLLGILGASVVTVRHFVNQSAPPLVVAFKPQMPANPTAKQNWFPAFEAVYHLDGKQPAKFISKKVPGRLLYYRQSKPDYASAIPKPDRITIQALPDGSVTNELALGPDMVWTTAQSLIRGLRLWQLKGDRQWLNLHLPGDWIVRPDANPDDVFAAMATAINARCGSKVLFRHDRPYVETILVSGNVNTGCQVINLPARADQSRITHIAHDDDPAAFKEPLEWEDTIPSILDEVSLYSGICFEMDPKFNDQQTRKLLCQETPGFASPSEMRSIIVKMLHDQTGLTLTPVRQAVDVWTLVER